MHAHYCFPAHPNTQYMRISIVSVLHKCTGPNRMYALDNALQVAAILPRTPIGRNVQHCKPFKKSICTQVVWEWKMHHFKSMWHVALFEKLNFHCHAY